MRYTFAVPLSTRFLCGFPPFDRRLYRWPRAAALATLAVALNASIVFATAGANMPWNAPLQALLNNLTGPTARVVVGLTVGLTGIVWMMKRHEEGGGRLLQAAIGGALLFGAQTMVNLMGFSGAAF
jgi:type IV secretory pathway VirB2 component (pilin)